MPLLQRRKTDMVTPNKLIKNSRLQVDLELASTPHVTKGRLRVRL